MARKKRTTKKKSSSRSRGRKRKSSRKSRTKREFKLNVQQKALVVGMATVFITAVIVLSLLSPNQGQLTAALAGLMWRTFGWGGVVVPLLTGFVGMYLVLWGMEQPPQLPTYRIFGFILLFLTLEAFASMAQVMRSNGLMDVWQVAQAGSGGGYLGGALAYALGEFLGNLGAIFTFMVFGAIGAVLLSGVTRADTVHFFAWLKEQRAARAAAKATEANEPVPVQPRLRINGRPADNLPPTPEPEPVTAVAPASKPTTQPESEPEPEPKPKRRSRRRKKAEPSPDDAPTEAAPIFLGKQQNGYNWKLPALGDVLDAGGDQEINSASIREQVEIIEHTLESFGAPATVVEINQGPTITQFGVEPNFLESRSGKRTKVKVGKIAGLDNDLALALAAHSIRIQAPVPGKGYVGIEVPNIAKALVSLRDVMESNEFQRISKKSPLTIGLGQNVSGQPIAADLTAMPHLLIAGTTGSGKSVLVNSIITCLLLQNTPDNLKLVMVDPKRVELTGYNGIPHLAAPVVVEMDRVIGTLQWALREMDNRYKLFADIGARNIGDYNKKVQNHEKRDPLPFIVIIIDELADLMMLAPEDTERAVTRLAQMARATGIHMVIATQRPSVDVVTGIIKANFPARVAFAVASSTDSRVILDTTGAERLLGQGDMLFQSPDAAAPIRLQGCFVSDAELKNLIRYWQTARRFNRISAESSRRPRREADTQSVQKNRNGRGAPSPPAVPPPQSNLGAKEEEKPASAPTKPEPKPEKEPESGNGPVQQPLWEALQELEEKPKIEYDDELLPEAIALVRKLNKASTSLLQRRFRIGYTRAARLMDIMEEQKIIGPPTGTSKAREVYPPEGEAEADATTTDTERDTEAEQAEDGGK